MEPFLPAPPARRGEPARVEWLIDCVWGAEPPPKASAALDTLIWRLRRILEPDRPARTPSTVVRTNELGYCLSIPATAVDSGLVASAAVAVLAMDEGTE